MEKDLAFLKDREINKGIPIPIYYQLKEILLEFIKHSNVGDRLPTEVELCKRYQISRPTARQAIRDLEVSGNVRRMQGRGTFVAEPKIAQEFLANIEDFEGRMKRLGYATTTKVLQLKEGDCDERSRYALKVEPGTKVTVLRRLIYANEAPMVLTLSYLPSAKFPNCEVGTFTDRSLVDVIQQDYGYKIRKIARSFEAKIVSDFEAELFGVKKGSPVQYVEATCYMDGDAPIAHTMDRYRADRNKFNFSLILP